MTKTKQAYHHDDLRSALLKATARIVAEKGVEGVTMRELTRRCGVSRTAPYRHFRDKSALLAAVAEEGFLKLGAGTRKARMECTGDAVRATQKAFLDYVEFAMENPTHYRLMFGREIANLFNHPGLAAAAAASFNEMVLIVTMGQQAGQLEPGSTLELVYTMWAQAHGLSMLIIDGLVRKTGSIRKLAIFSSVSLLKGMEQAANRRSKKAAPHGRKSV
jgi:AcrR family transcriptional regulator